MEIKFQKHLSDYKYVVMFDLASKITGVCLWDIQNHRPAQTSIIDVTKCKTLPVAALYDQLDAFFSGLNKMGISLSDILVYKEAMPSQIHGAATTIQTFIDLARSHGILDLYCAQHNIDVFDYTGVYPITWHCYLRKLRGWDNKHPVDKKDTRDYLYETYNLSNLILDESDAVFLAQTFVELVWNKQIDEQIREVKRHRKTLKAAHAINSCDEEIKRLDGLKITN